ncbi:MAG TPA: methylmalonyl-CoA epimerase [bacterium]
MNRINHIAIAVTDLEAAETTYRDVLGLEWQGREEVVSQKVMTSIFRMGESRVELISPTAEDSPIAAFLAKRGNGLHHICFEVENIEAEMQRLKSRGARLLSEKPTAGVGKSKVIFLRPQDAHGVLVELVEKAR